MSYETEKAVHGAPTRLYTVKAVMYPHVKIRRVASSLEAVQAVERFRRMGWGVVAVHHGIVPVCEAKLRQDAEGLTAP